MNMNAVVLCHIMFHDNAVSFELCVFPLEFLFMRWKKKGFFFNPPGWAEMVTITL